LGALAASFAFLEIGTRKAGVSDLLVPLLKLPPLEPYLEPLRVRGIAVRTARAYEKTATRRFVLSHFSQGWADEVDVAFSRAPIGCYLATHESKIVGFAVIESTAKDYFGPTGVGPSYRGLGVGAALLVAALHGLRERGYVYGIIGGAGPVAFYEKTVHAVAIAGSDPGIYSDLLAPDSSPLGASGGEEGSG
jgi:GNAT superfamily N-acetyltransferase